MSNNTPSLQFQSSAPMTSNSQDPSEMVGDTAEDSFNDFVDKIADKILSPYLDEADKVEKYDDNHYYYLPPQSNSY